MPDGDNDSPFAEKTGNRWVWIVPSVLLHVVVLIVWLLMPEEPPRERPERELTIHSDQAEQLQQHVEDANLRILRAQVAELQTIKQAMAEIRDRRMSDLRKFEENMVVEAPVEATQLFTRLMDSQTQVLKAYQQVLKSTQASLKIAAKVEPLLKEEQIAAALSELRDLQKHWEDARAQADVITRETAQTFALVNTGEINLSWLRDDSVQGELTALKQSMETAQSRSHQVVATVSKSFSGRPSEYLDDLVNRHDEFITLLETFKQDQIDGPKEVEAQRQLKREEIQTIQGQVEEWKKKQKQIETEISNLPKDAGKEQKDALAAQGAKIKVELNKLESRLSQAEQSLKRIRDYRMSGTVSNKVKGLQRILGGIIVSEPNVAQMTEAMEAQVKVVKAAQALLDALAKQVNAAGEVVL